MEAYKVYNRTKEEYKEVCKIANGVIQSFEECYGPCFFHSELDSLSKLYRMISSGYGDILWPFLERLDYSYSAEFQTIFATMDLLLRSGMSVMFSNNWTCYYSIENLVKLQDYYVLDTKEGTLVITPLTGYRADKRIYEYANRRSYYGFCHDATERFTKENPEYQAVTSLMPLQFGRKHYHSYIKKDGKVFDFAHNICMDEDAYQTFMRPTLLNEVYGYELEGEQKKLGNDELGPEKCLLLRLAVAKQRKE